MTLEISGREKLEWKVVFKTFLDSFVIVFIDDILVYSRIDEELANHLRTILDVLGKKK